MAADLFVRYRCTVCARLVREAFKGMEHAMADATSQRCWVSLVCAQCSNTPDCVAQIHHRIDAEGEQVILATGEVVEGGTR